MIKLIREVYTAPYEKIVIYWPGQFILIRSNWNDKTVLPDEHSANKVTSYTIKGYAYSFTSKMCARHWRMKTKTTVCVFNHLFSPEKINFVKEIFWCSPQKIFISVCALCITLIKLPRQKIRYIMIKG